ncbi:MAG: hypothetical protein A2V70_17905 [Planctomycetes bacterium RBG_13_63_9]|nr:MAG: hypothetical protein A2V70_17905 [Planctomycetes bacterium RBG_13_63_9]
MLSISDPPALSIQTQTKLASSRVIAPSISFCASPIMALLMGPLRRTPIGRQLPVIDGSSTMTAGGRSSSAATSSRREGM